MKYTPKGKKYQLILRNIAIPLLSLLLVGIHLPKQDRISETGLKNSIILVGEYLQSQIREDGQFVYRVNMDTCIELSRKYNILRHSGSIYSLGQYYKFHKSDTLKKAILKAADFLKRETIAPVTYGDIEMLAIWSTPELSNQVKYNQVKLGGSGLGLVSLMTAEDLSPGFTPLEELRKLGDFILFMQKENGSFYSKYIPSLNGPDDSWESLYYPGEAMLGLLLLYELDPLDKWMEGAISALGYLAESRKGKKNLPQDHWALIATAKLFKLSENSELKFDRELAISHAVQICKSMMREQVSGKKNKYLNGGFNRVGSTTSAATNLEGMTSALKFLPEKLKIREELHESCIAAINFLLKAIILEGKYKGGVPFMTKKPEFKSNHSKSFKNRATEIRIDYVQHTLSALIQYYQLTEKNR